MIYTDDTRNSKTEELTVMTIGRFDSRHKGHRKLLREILRTRREYGLATTVFTLNTAPMVLIQDRPQTVVTTNRERHNNMKGVGIDYLVEYPSSKKVAHLPPEGFVSHVLLGQMNTKAIVVGTDYGLDYQRAGNVKPLRELTPKYDCILEVIDKIRENDRDISNTHIKEKLDMEAIEKASELLEGPYAVHGTMAHGNHISGTVLNFPITNIPSPPEGYLPSFDMYAPRVLIDGTYCGDIINIGKKPTVEGEYPVGVETFVFGFSRNIYGEGIGIQLLYFEQPGQRFISLEDLKRQLEKNKEYGLRYLRKHGLI